TEDTTYSTYHLVPRGADLVLVGTPVANTQAYVLDDHLQPVPVGVVGELYLAGDGLSRGYAKRPGMTAERFVPCPFGAPGARMYRVMDRVRRRTDGELEYLGRTDFQVKVRGYRIELGEIEARLAEHAGVREAVVLVREDTPGEKRLVAYVAGDETAAAEVLRAHLSERLPQYMVPAAYVRLDALPLTPNGKVDRRALPAPEGGAFPARGYEAPSGKTEEAVAAIWADLLGVKRVGRHDDFFHLGGNSLLATRLVFRIRREMDVELSVRDVFEKPELSLLAQHLLDAQLAQSDPNQIAELLALVRAADVGCRNNELLSEPISTTLSIAERERILEMARAGRLERSAPKSSSIVPVERTGALPLSFAQKRLWFIDRLEPGSAVYNLPVAQRLGGALDEAALERALGEIVRRHEALRTTFAEVDGSPVQVIAPFGGFSLPVEDLSDLSEADREAARRRRAGEEARRAFDLSAGPLFRAAVLRLGEEDHVLLLSMHHIVSDEWSMGVLFRELWALYAAYREGRESPLAELAVQYADYAVWQREQLEGEVLDRQLAYWRERLADAPALLELPTDHPRPAVQTYRGATVPVELSPELLERLQALGRSEGATLYMTLLGAFQVLLSKYSGSEDIVVGSSIAGRTRKEFEELIGFFVNTLVLRTGLSGDPSFREVLRRAREVTLGAYAHQEVPFEKLVAELQPERSLSHSPLFQVMFTVENAGGGGGALPGLSVSGVGAEHVSAKFDLSLTLTPTPRGLRGGLTYST
ncbi:MAG TPA: condensation domain-containing protein, partial [Longimicrobiaceae bacterium]|nr:condensation domain-containing protein [Longimicrobiaceae bacterium]